MNYTNEQLRQKKERYTREAQNMCRQNNKSAENKTQNKKSEKTPQLSGIFSLLEGDNIIILLLAFLLLKENCNKEIILALIYILI